MQHSEDCFLKVPKSASAFKTCVRAGFTLIELLVVIAIIGILAALLFPVFATLQENSRQNNTMAHMHDISAGLALYKLDNKAYPPVLFAYACDADATAVETSEGATAGCNTADSMATIGSDPNATNELVGLYPEYVSDWHSFTCDSDLNNDPQGAYTTTSTGTGGPGTGPQPDYLDGNNDANYLTLVPPTGTEQGATYPYPYRSYFTSDAFDINPEVQGEKELVGTPGQNAGNYTYVLRYQTSWTSFCSGYNPANLTETPPPAPPCDANYPRQLRWANPPANTYVTAVTYHVATANKLIVLYEGGFVQKVDMYSTEGQPDQGAWIEPPVNGTSNPASTAAQPSVGPVPATGGCVASAGGATCNYSNATFWQYDKGQ